MIKVIVRLLGISLLLLAQGSARAEIVGDLYSAEVPVANQTSAVLDGAAGVALGEVLVKVSGSVGVLQNREISLALADANKNVQQYAYNRDRRPEGGLTARFEFDRSYVTRLIIEAQAPLWTANRPVVLVWLAIEDASGRQFVNWDTQPELAAELMREFSRRGVPAQLPLFDLADATALTPEQVWRLDGAALTAASARYEVKDVLGGRLANLANGNVAGDWVYLHEGERLERSGTVAGSRLFFESGVALVAEEMAARYAVAPSSISEKGVSMSVAGVSSYADYAAIVAWLEGLELIEHANVARIDGERIELRLMAQADANQLAAIIELNKRLVPIPAPAPAPVPVSLPVSGSLPGSAPTSTPATATVTATPAPGASGVAAVNDTLLSYRWQN